METPDTLWLDMHCHTTGSDGIHTRDELINHAKKKWLEALFITDHDRVSLDHVNAIWDAGLITAPSVEITTTDYDRLWETGKDIHMTYYARNFSDELLSVFERKRREKQEYISDFVVYLQEQWFDISDKGFYGTYYIAHDIVMNKENNWKLQQIGVKWESQEEQRRSFYRDFLNKWKILHTTFHAERWRWYFKPQLADIADITRWEWVLSFAHPNFTFERQDIRWFLELYRDFYLPSLWISAVEINSKASQEWVWAILDLDKEQLTFGSDCHRLGKPDNKHGDLWFENNFLDAELVQREFWNFRDRLWI